MDLEEHGGVEPVIKRRCEECGVELTEQEIRAAIDSDSAFLCTVHAAEQVEIEEEELPEN